MLFSTKRTLEDLESRVKTLETLRSEVSEMRRELDNFRLDYQGLYEKVRVQLSKLRKRAEDGSPAGPLTDPLTEARKLLTRRILSRG